MALDVGEDRKRKAAERVKRASCLPSSLFGCAARSSCTLAPLAPLRPLAPPCPPLAPSRPFATPQDPHNPRTTPHDLNAPSRPLSPPYRHKGLDCFALEQAIGEGHAAELPAADLKAAEAVLEKARAAEKAKCEKDLRDKMKARSLTRVFPCPYALPMPAAKLLLLPLPARPSGPHCTPLGPKYSPPSPLTTEPPGPSLQHPSPLTTAPPVPSLRSPQSPFYPSVGAAAAGCRQAGPQQGAHTRHPGRAAPRATRAGRGQAARSVAAAHLLEIERDISRDLSRDL